MAYVHIEPEVRYFDIVVDGIDASYQMELLTKHLSGSHRNTLCVREVNYLDEDDQFTIRVFLETHANTEGVRHQLWTEITVWFNEQSFLAAQRTRLEDRLVINLAEKPKAAAA